MVATPDLTKTDPVVNTDPAGTASSPVKRRPGRPRKNPLPVHPVTPDMVAAEVVPVIEAPAAAPKPPPAPRTFPDDRIGLAVHPLAEAIGFDDGRTYRCADGKIVERLT